MDSVRLPMTLVVLFSGIVLVATSEQAESNHLPPVLRAFQQNRPQDEVAPVRHTRVKRQNGVIIDSIFQIPITTLSAVNNLFKNSVLAFQSWRQGAPGSANQNTGTATNYQSSASTSALQYSGGSNNIGASSFNGGNGYYSNNYYRPPRKYQSSAAVRGDLPVKNDGSSYRI